MSRRPNADWNFAPAVRRLLQDDGRHPAPHWCPRCGQLENAGCNHPRGTSGPPPLPKGRVWAAARRRRHALVALTRITGGVR